VKSPRSRNTTNRIPRDTFTILIGTILRMRVGTPLAEINCGKCLVPRSRDLDQADTHPLITLRDQLAGSAAVTCIRFRLPASSGISTIARCWCHPFSDERFAPRFDFLARCRVVVVGSDLFFRQSGACASRLRGCRPCKARSGRCPIARRSRLPGVAAHQRWNSGRRRTRDQIVTHG